MAVLLQYIQPSIYISNIRIDEPVTALTDLVFATVCFYALYRIKRQGEPGRIKALFTYYFLTLGLSAFFGGLFGHAFLYGLSAPWKLISWIFTLASVGIITHALIEMSRSLIKPFLVRVVTWINLLFLLMALFHTIWTLEFVAVKYYTTFGMLAVVGSLSYLIFQKTGNRGVVSLMIAVGIGFVSVVVFSYKWGFSPWFNHNDISHVILAFSALILYKGASEIVETPVHLPEQN
ncbi:MAG: hypothetical protein ABFS10_13840 [Bacteroidota bacterium]